ncbi:MAG: hypothetical protein M3478_04395 [Planctomycetota bacterium]|nr:hypothetical protein [Planctomycetota bacterium]
MCFACINNARVARTAFALLLTAAVVLTDSPARGAETEGSLTPCLAMDAAGGPIYPTSTFVPAGRELVAVFALGPEDGFDKLTARWIAVDVGDVAPANTTIGENEMELKARRKGLLRYSQTGPLPVGKYRLEVLARGKEWKTADLTVAAPPADAVERDAAAPLFEVGEGKSIAYTMTGTPGAGVKLNIPNAKPGDDGVVRADLSQKFAPADENGIPVETHISGQLVSTGYLKNDATGLFLIAHKDGDKIVKAEEPHTFVKLPLSHGMEWPYTVGKNGKGVTRVWGPLPVEGPGGPKPGWVVVGKEEYNISKPGTSSIESAVTTERHFLPGFGMVKEVRTSTIGEKLDSRHEIVLNTNKAFEIVATPKMKGRLGRVMFKFPEGAKVSGTQIAVVKAGAKKGERPIHSGYGNASFDLLPGTYAVVISGKIVDAAPVKSGHETMPIVGVLRLNADSNTAMKVFDADKKSEVYSGYGSADVGLPVGTYHVQVAGQMEEVRVEGGKVTEF